MIFLLVDVFRVFGSGGFLAGVFLVSFSWVWSGMVFVYFVLPTPPRSVPGLVWVIGPLICGTGHVPTVVGWVFGVVLDFLRVIFLLVFDIHFSLFHISPSPSSPVAGDMAMVFLDDFFPPLKAGSSFNFFSVLCRLRCLAVQRRGSGF